MIVVTKRTKTAFEFLCFNIKKTKRAKTKYGIGFFSLINFENSQMQAIAKNEIKAINESWE